MRTFDIYNAAKRDRRPCARLSYDEREDKMRITLAADAAPADLPLMLALFAERGERHVPDTWARKWVEERIPPQGRQNLGEILRANGLVAYDEISLLAAAQGRSAQDDFLIREVAQSQVAYAVVGLDGDEGAHEASGEKGRTAASLARSWCEVIGSAIAERRKAAGMTQRDLAERTGIDQAAVSRIEAGRANPTLNTLDALARGVGCDLIVTLGERAPV